MVDIVSKAVLLGLSTGTYCAVSCLPLLVPTLFSRNQKHIGRISVSLIKFIAGRFVAYMAFGVIAGLTGVFLNELDLFQNIVIPAVYFIIGAIMVGYGITGIFKHKNTCRVIDRKFQNSNYLFVLGFLMGINFCPPFILAFGVAAEFMDLLKSLMFFTVFFIVTTLFFIPLIFSGFAAKLRLINKIARYSSILAGLYFIYLAVYAVLLLAGVIELNY